MNNSTLSIKFDYPPKVSVLASTNKNKHTSIVNYRIFPKNINFRIFKLNININLDLELYIFWNSFSETLFPNQCSKILSVHSYQQFN